MAWEIPKYSKVDINKAGKNLIDKNSSEEQKNKAFEILDNWRSIHSYPMHVFQMRLRDKSQKIDKNSLVAQRLKRVPAIIFKLGRSYGGHSPSMELYQMQDIGGCRAVLSDITQVRKLCDDYYLKGDLKHKRIGYKDYICNPKKDGYRSIHLVYEYKSDKGKQEFNGLRVEVQIRSKLQHLWATANEIIELFTGQAIKTTDEQNEWKDFFKLVSSAFAQIEKCSPIEGTPSDEKELYNEIKKKETELNVIRIMTGWTSAIGVFQQTFKSLKAKPKFFLLELDISGDKLSISSYTKQEEAKAIEEYSRAEKRIEGRKGYNVVLVGVETMNDLEKAYPNYFVDTTDFLTYLNKIIKKY
jgi:ppGpp synthetase/RelA/SpoT-type nucleotidyltranferase